MEARRALVRVSDTRAALEERRARASASSVLASAHCCAAKLLVMVEGGEVGVVVVGAKGGIGGRMRAVGVFRCRQVELRKRYQSDTIRIMGVGHRR